MRGAGHRRWPPGLAALDGYQRAWLRDDLVAGAVGPSRVLVLGPDS